MAKTSWSDGDVVTAAELNRIEDQLVVVCTSGTRPTGVEGQQIYETDTDARYVYNGSSWVARTSGWTSFTPTFTNLSIGNGTATFKYRYVDGDLHVVGSLSFGSTTSVSGAVTMTLPNSASASTPSAVGHVVFIDNTGTDSTGVCLVSTTTLQIYTSAVVAMNTTVPFTWATSDVLRVDIRVVL